MSINVPLLKTTLAYIEAHPEEWDQSEWRCGTGACFAGHAAILHGAKWRGRNATDMHVISPDGATYMVDSYAREALGLELRPYTDPNDKVCYYGIELFRAGNSLDDLRRIVGELCAQAESEAAK